MYVPDNRAAEYLKQKCTDLKKETDDSTITLRKFNSPLPTKFTDRKSASTQKSTPPPLYPWQQDTHSFQVSTKYIPRKNML